MSKCLLGGCGRSTRLTFLVCDEHAVEIWGIVESVKDTPASPIPSNVVLPARPPSHLDGGWIYYLRLDEKIKIGWTANYIQRMKAYPPHARVIARHPGARADERDLHRSFKPSRVAGREWYAPTPELMRHIEQVHEDNRRRFEEEQAAREAARPAPPPGRPAEPRPLRGQALVRAILDGTVT